MATLPSPMTAPRSMLLEPVLPDYGPQGLVEDGEPVERGLFADDQRRVDAHRRRIRHRGEPAPEALLVERLGHVLSERLLGAAVLDELHAQHQAAPAHLAHAAVLLLERFEPRWRSSSRKTSSRTPTAWAPSCSRGRRS